METEILSRRERQGEGMREFLLLSGGEVVRRVLARRQWSRRFLIPSPSLSLWERNSLRKEKGRAPYFALK